jgi:hypothetical protein
MHALGKVVLWFAVVCFLLIVEKNIPKDETGFRMAVALTWLLWMILGALYGMRGVWRFLRS